jgi:large subunit ribosomal protein L24
MKPTKMRNRQIYKATHTVRSGQVGAALSKDLRERYGRKSIRVIKGDTVSVVRGEFKEIDGKIAKVWVSSGRVAIEGIKKEKGKGDKIDILIHASNLVVTSLNTDDSKRMAKIDKKGQPPGDASGITEAATDKVATDASTSEIKEAATGENKEGAVADESAGTNKPDTKSNEADTNSKMHEQQTGESK